MPINGKTKANLPIITDNSSSGYFDIGTMRIQWGKVPSGASSVTVTLPAPFANANYNVTANCSDNSTTAVIGITIRSGSSRTTTSFIAYRGFANPGSVGGASESFDWIAIGLK